MLSKIKALIKIVNSGTFFKNILLQAVKKSDGIVPIPNNNIAKPAIAGLPIVLVIIIAL